MPDIQAFRATLAEIEQEAKMLGLPWARQSSIRDLIPTLDLIENMRGGVPRTRFGVYTIPA